MIPTALAFPATVRMANTPPVSETLARVRKQHVALGPQPVRHHEEVINLQDRLLKNQHEDFHAALSAGELYQAQLIQLGASPHALVGKVLRNA